MLICTHARAEKQNLSFRILDNNIIANAELMIKTKIHDVKRNVSFALAAREKKKMQFIVSFPSRKQATKSVLQTKFFA